MRTRSAAMLAVALVATMAACGDGSSGGYSSAQQIADKLGCSGLSQDSSAVSPAPVYECQLDGQQVTIVYAKDSSARDATVDFANKANAAFGTDGGKAVVGGTWAVLGSSDASGVASKLGGKVR